MWKPAVTIANVRLLKRFVPKHIPHNPVRAVSSPTRPILPSQVILKAANETIRTITVWPIIIVNCVITCPNRISVPVRPIEKSIVKIYNLIVFTRKNSVSFIYQKLNFFRGDLRFFPSTWHRK